VEFLKEIPVEIILKYVESLCRNNPKYMYEIIGMYVAEKELGIKVEKCDESIADLCSEHVLIDIEHVPNIDDNTIIYEIISNDRLLRRIAKYMFFSNVMKKVVYFIFVKSVSEYKIFTLYRLLRLIDERYPHIYRQVIDYVQEYSNKLISTNSSDLELIVVELYRKGYSKYAIARRLGISIYRVMKILVKHGLEKISENVCPRCFRKLVDLGDVLYCPNCGFRKSKSLSS